MKKRKILFIMPYPPGIAPSQRFRYEQYLDLLRENGFEIDQRSFWSEKTFKVLYAKGNYIKKTIGLWMAILKRYLLVFRIHRYDFVFMHREFSPVGFPLMIWIISKILGKKIIFDYDDAIWIPNVSKSNRFFSLFKVYSNTRRLIKLSYKISCGNEYLCDYARQYSSNVFYNPTTVDTVNLHNRQRILNNEKFVIGWTGSHSTMQYLDEVVPIIKKLEKEFPLEFRVISDTPPDLDLDCLRFIQWNKATEVEDLLAFSVGVMPLKHDQWAEGKCGFKALQYMSLGIPALVSPVGVNTFMVDHGVDGFYCRDSDEWEHYLRKLIQDKTLLVTMSSRTREKVEKKYSVRSNTKNFLSLFS
jgi:glycosyltransferase involved in cell wall biosynthesis